MHSLLFNIIMTCIIQNYAYPSNMCTLFQCSEISSLHTHTHTHTQPYDHQRAVAKYHHASKEHLQDAIDAAMEARREWESMPFEHRAAIFLKAGDLIATKYRPDILATTMVGQAKTVLQAEIDAACEVIDFYRFAVAFAADLYKVSHALHRFNCIL